MWKPIETAPYGRVLLVRNPKMDKPVRATRGYVWNGTVHEDQSLFTSVFTPDDFFPMGDGHLVCPTEWTELEETTHDPS